METPQARPRRHRAAVKKEEVLYFDLRDAAAAGADRSSAVKRTKKPVLDETQLHTSLEFNTRNAPCVTASSGRELNESECDEEAQDLLEAQSLLRFFSGKVEQWGELASCC